MCVGTGSAFAAGSFVDVPQGTWYTEAIAYVTENGYFNGVSQTHFDPGGSMTRGMFVTVLGRMAKVDKNPSLPGIVTKDSVNLRSEPNTDSKILALLAKNTSLKVLGEVDGWHQVQVGDVTGYIRGDLMKVIVSTFKDVPADAYYAPYVQWATVQGLVSGTTATTFSPDAPISREQLCTILYNFACAYEIDLGELNFTKIFADDAEISSWAQTAVYVLQGIGVINGRDADMFAPKSGATRAEVAVILKRFTDVVGKANLPNAGVQFGVPVPESAAVNDSYFDDACFIGHSLVVGMSDYFRLPNADFYAVNGISASRMLTYDSFPLENKDESSGEEEPAYGTLEEVLAEKEDTYGKVYIMLGTNELGPREEHVKQYTRSMEALIDLVRKSQPTAEIYLISIIPVSEERSLVDSNFNRENVLIYNEALMGVSLNKEAYYLDAYHLLADEDGYLPADSCMSDGIHIFAAQYAQIKQYLKTHTV